MTLIPINEIVRLTIVWKFSPVALPSLPVVTISSLSPCFSFRNLQNAETEVTTSNGVKFSFGGPSTVPLNPEIFFIKVILIVNI